MGTTYLYAKHDNTPQITNIHIPKCGSTSTSKFYEDCITFGYMQGIHKLNADVNHGGVTFTVLREPLERFKSNVNYFLQNNRKEIVFTRDEIIDISLNYTYTNEEMSNVLKYSSKDAEAEVNIVLHSLSIFDSFYNVFDENKNLKAKHLLNIKNLKQELENILPDWEYKHFPHTNRSKGEDFALTNEQLDKFNYKYREDIEFYKQTGF